MGPRAGSRPASIEHRRGAGLLKVVVIGAGFGGLAAAIRLSARGHQVTIVEKCDQPGGRASVVRQDGYTFDLGPTIVTAPQLFEALFEAAGRRLSDYVRLVPLDPFYQVRFGDGSVFCYRGQEDALEREVARLAPGDVHGYRRFAAAAQQVYDAAFPLVDRPFTTLGSMLRSAPQLVRVRAWRSVADLANAHFSDERLRQVFSFHPLLIGGHPFDTSAIYGLIHPLEKTWGVWFPMGGTGTLVAALVRLFTDLGGELKLSAEVAGIEVDSRARWATGVRLVSGERLAADAIVSNADVADTYLRLVPRAARPRNTDRRLQRLRYSMSVVVIAFGTNRRYEHMAHHEILMGPRYRGLLDDIFHRLHLPDDFSLYLHRPTATDPSLAPPGCDAWYVLSPVPHLGSGVDWAAVGPAYRDAIMRSLEERFLPDLRRHIVTEHMIDPRHFRTELNSYLGSAFSVAPTLMQSAWFRPHNVSEDVPNLFFAGAGTHPGAGLPGVISSGKIAADLVQGLAEES